MILASDLLLDRDGAQKVANALNGEQLRRLAKIIDDETVSRPGGRLRARDPRLADIIDERGVGAILEAVTGQWSKPVRVVAFDKNEQLNWSLAWHQDRTILVRGRHEVEGFGPWSMKQGMTHVAPPTDLLAQMFTVRLHVDDCGPENAPLRIGLGSHRLGLVPVADVDAAAARCQTFDCLAGAGDAWFYKTLILHASDAATAPKRRRVLQIDYAPFDLPGGLEWLE